MKLNFLKIFTQYSKWINEMQKKIEGSGKSGIFYSSASSESSNSGNGRNSRFTAYVLDELKAHPQSFSSFGHNVSEKVKGQSPTISYIPVYKFQFFRGGSSDNNITANRNQIKLMDDGDNFYKNSQYNEAIAAYEELAGNGNAAAQYKLGVYYHVIKKDQIEALQWFYKSADNKYPDAMEAIGNYYLNGWRNLPKDSEKAVQWFCADRDREGPKGQRKIAGLYENGSSGFLKDLYSAINWYSKTAENGDLKSQLHLADYYFSGMGGYPQDYRKALKWYKKAALQGDSGAKERVSLLRDKGFID